MLSLVEMNKQMIRNIQRRVNATQAEDYALIQTYNQLLNQHIKLYKELQQTYKNIPATLKKMKADVLLDSDQQNDLFQNNHLVKRIFFVVTTISCFVVPDLSKY